MDVADHSQTELARRRVPAARHTAGA